MTARANVFVAGFIGSPAMNFFRVDVVGSVDEMYLQAAEMRLRVPESRAQQLAAYLNKEVTLGVRPEDIHDATYVPPGLTTSTVEARVEITELMGNEIFVYLQSGGNSFLGRVDPRTSARPGLELQVAFDMNSMHVFDPETEASIVTVADEEKVRRDEERQAARLATAGASAEGQEEAKPALPPVDSEEAETAAEA